MTSLSSEGSGEFVSRAERSIRDGTAWREKAVRVWTGAVVLGSIFLALPFALATMSDSPWVVMTETVPALLFALNLRSALRHRAKLLREIAELRSAAPTETRGET